MKVYFLFLIGVLLIGCGGGESSSSILAGGKPGSSVDVPVPATPQEPGEGNDDGNTQTDSSGRLISSADGSTPPPPPSIVR